MMVTGVSEEFTASIFRAQLEATGSSGTFVIIYKTTLCDILEDSDLHI
jgi:hypothetical protein